MKTYQVVLTKSYAVTVRADSAQKAERVVEFYTSNVKDISTNEDRKKFNFSIEEIECGMNESLEAEEAKED